MYAQAHASWNDLWYLDSITSARTVLTVTPAPDYQPKIAAMASQFQVSPDGYSAIGLGTTVDAEGHVRVFWDDTSYGDIANSTPVNQYLVREYDSAGRPLADPVVLTPGASPLTTVFAGLPDGSFDEVYAVATLRRDDPHHDGHDHGAALQRGGGPHRRADHRGLGIVPEIRLFAPVARRCGRRCVGRLADRLHREQRDDRPGRLCRDPLGLGRGHPRPWRVNSHTVGVQGDARVALNASGDGIITWDDADNQTIMGRRLTGAGRSNDPTELYVYQDPSLSYSVEDDGVDALGNITVAFGDREDDPRPPLWGRRHRRRRTGGIRRGDDRRLERPARRQRPGVGIPRLGREADRRRGCGRDAREADQPGGEDSIDVAARADVHRRPAVDVQQRRGLRRRGQISVLFTQLDPNDPELARTAVFSRLYRADMAPEFAGRALSLLGGPGQSGGHRRGTVEATDPDGDPVLYSLQGSRRFRRRSDDRDGDGRRRLGSQRPPPSARTT